MTVGLTTWDALPAPAGPVLLVLNVEPGDTAAADAALNALAGWAGREALHVVASAAWAEWLAAQGVAEDRVLVAADDQGRDVELTYFLHTSRALPWIAGKRFAAVMGARPHNLFNEEVQGPFERQVCLLLGGGRMLAQTLPRPYVYVFDVAALVWRSGRPARLARYTVTAQGALDDLRHVWHHTGQPGPDEGPDAASVSAVLARHLDAGILTFDEATPPLPWAGETGVPRAVAQWFDDLRGAVLDRDHRLSSLGASSEERVRALLLALEERNAAVQQRDTMLHDLETERAEAVALRDRIIDDLRAELTRVPPLADRLLAVVRPGRRKEPRS